VRIPFRENVVTTYSISMVADTREPQLAQRFVNFVRFSTTSQGILRTFGFAKPW